MFEKQGVLILAKELDPGSAWWTYYIPFSSFGRVLDAKGQSIVLATAAEWVNENYEIDPTILARLHQEIDSGTNLTYYSFEVAPR